MTSYKPESALKRAQELIDVDKPESALDVLHGCVMSKTFRQQHNATIDALIFKHIELAVQLRQPRKVKEALNQFKTLCGSVGSYAPFEDVIDHLRTTAEDALAANKKAAGIEDDMSKAPQVRGVEDLEAEASPEQVLMASVQQSKAQSGKETQDKDVTNSLRFTWDVYRAINEHLRSLSKLEEKYFELIKDAFDFCVKNQRIVELRRFCETLRNQWAQLLKPVKGGKPADPNPNSPETLQRTLDSRLKQLDLVVKLDMSKEAFNTIEDMKQLMDRHVALNKGKKCPPRIQVSYFDNFARISWFSNSTIYHTAALLKTYELYMTSKKKDDKSFMMPLATRSVLSAMCVPLKETKKDNDDGAFERTRKMANLCYLPNIPTRKSLVAEVTSKRVLNQASEAAQTLFSLLESQFTPLTLCEAAKPCLDALIAENETLYKPYVEELKQIIFVRLLGQLSQVYANMRIETLEQTLAGLIDFNTAEKWIVAASRDGMQVKIDHVRAAIIFGNTKSIHGDVATFQEPLKEVGIAMHEAVVSIDPSNSAQMQQKARKKLYPELERQVARARRGVEKRKDEIERRKEERERKEELQREKELEQAQLRAEQEAQRDKELKDKQKKEREKARADQIKKKADNEKAWKMVEDMKRNALLKGLKVKIGNKKIEDIEKTDIAAIGLKEIEKVAEEQASNERTEKIRRRKFEVKRVDHLYRALRQEEQALIAQEARENKKSDQEFYDLVRARRAKESKKAVAMVTEQQAFVSAWMDKHRKNAGDGMTHAQAVESHQKMVMSDHIIPKLNRARDRQEAGERPGDDYEGSDAEDDRQEWVMSGRD